MTVRTLTVREHVRSAPKPTKYQAVRYETTARLREEVENWRASRFADEWAAEFPAMCIEEMRGE